MNKKRYYLLLTTAVLLTVTIAAGSTSWMQTLIGRIKPTSKQRLTKQRNLSKPVTRREKTKLMCTRKTGNGRNWRRELSPLQYDVLRNKATEKPFTGRYYHFNENGTYLCAGCGNQLFDSEAKFDSGTGWPSFKIPLSKQNVKQIPDRTHYMLRTEVVCARCGGHLGHLFDDGPPPSGLRYCINSAALNFVPENQKYEKATFAAGCFWGVEENFRKIPGVVSTTVGYIGGKTKNPAYHDVCSDKTGHAEAVQIIYDPNKISYQKLLETFWKTHDPTTLNRQGPDVGSQYRSQIFYHNQKQRDAAEKSREKLQNSNPFQKPIATRITPASTFYRAQEYHQKYLKKRRLK